MKETRCVGQPNQTEVLDVVLGSQIQHTTVEALCFGRVSFYKGSHGSSPQVVGHEVHAPTSGLALSLLRHLGLGVVAPSEPRLGYLFEASTVRRFLYGFEGRTPSSQPDES